MKTLFSLVILGAFLNPHANAQTPPPYPAIFKKAREIYLAPSLKQRKKLAKNLNESAIVELLQNHPESLSKSSDKLIQDLETESLNSPDPTKHLRLIPPKNEAGYSELKYYASHDFYLGDKKVSKSNLVKVWSDFLSQAKTQIILNVFDFDLVEIADLLIEKSKAGVQVRVGIDSGVIADRPEVKQIYDKLNAGGVKVTSVDSVKLNHQKVATVDWEDSKLARVLFSSGNLTQSCLGPEGDLKALPEKIRPKGSIPNANHVLTLKSWLLANLVHHELTKTLDPAFALRGSLYPTTGSYQITGPGVNPYTLEAYPEHSVVITFSPGGGLRSINKNIIAHFIKKSTGPIRMIQFAFSSQEVATALLEKAQSEFQTKKAFDFDSVGDTPFAVQGWSQFLKMSGLKLEKISKKKKQYLIDETNPWVTELRSDLDKIRPKIRIAPPEYRTYKVKVASEQYQISAKIHHKVLSAAPFVIVGTSFNFSEGAETNNEQILTFHEPELVQFANGMERFLAEKSAGSVYDEAMKRNRQKKIYESTERMESLTP